MGGDVPFPIDAWLLETPWLVGLGTGVVSGMQTAVGWADLVLVLRDGVLNGL